MRTAASARSTIEAEAILSGLGFRLLERTPIEWKRDQLTPLMLIDTDRGRFVLKLRTPPASFRSRLRKALADLELVTQVLVYGALSEQEFRALRFPGLVETDGRDYLLLEYVDTRPHGEQDLPYGQLLESLFEFQLAPVRLEWSGSRALVARTRTPFTLLVRRLLGGIREELGWRAARRGLGTAFACRSAQRPLDREIVCHNDFHYNNLLLDPTGQLYFSDFEAVTLERRWALADIVYFAVGTHEFRIDTDIIAEYYSLLTKRTGLALDLRAQVRFGLLVRVSKLVLSSAPPRQVAAKYRSFLEGVVLDDDAFDAWLVENFAQRV